MGTILTNQREMGDVCAVAEGCVLVEDSADIDELKYYHQKQFRLTPGLLFVN